MYHIPQYKIIKKIKIIIVHSKSIPNIQLAKKKKNMAYSKRENNGTFKISINQIET
jgi:hypothetical protein